MRQVLIDTHLLLWAAFTPERLSPETLQILTDVRTDLIFSVASLWEISIKSGLGRADFAVDARLLRRSLLDNGYCELPINGEHTLAIDQLPPLHKDPFDRILVAQATVEGMILLTADTRVAQYAGPVRRV